MSSLTFKEIVGELPLVTGDPEGFYHVENYQQLWEELNALTGNAISITDWKGELVDDTALHLEFTIEGDPIVLDFEYADFLEEAFIQAVNAHLPGEKRFVMVAPGGIDNFDQSYNFMYLTPEHAQTLFNNQYAFPIR